MKFLPYIFKHLRRNWLRTGSTVLAMSVCIFLFCTLRSVVDAIDFSLESANASRIITRHSVSLVFSLPLSYGPRIARVPGVRRVATSAWFGGVYVDRKNFFANFAVESVPYFAMHPEYLIDKDEWDAYLRDRRGAVVGPGLASQYHWKIGDTVQMTSDIPPYQKGSPFEFVIRAIYRTDDTRFAGTSPDLFFFHYDYLWEGTGRRIGAGIFNVEIDDPNHAGAISRAIDALFENSDAATKTETESAFLAGMISQLGNLTLLMNVIGLAVTFTILLVTANTMSMAVRERGGEIAVLKTLGFGSLRVLFLVLAEALALGAAGGLLGIAIAKLMLTVLEKTPFLGDVLRAFPDVGLSTHLMATGLTLSLGVGFAAGIVPAIVAYRARITDALRAV